MENPSGAGRLGWGLSNEFCLPAKPCPHVLQTEATECGLACLVMIARYHGHDIDLNALRKTASVSLKGASLKQIMATAGEMHLGARPLRVEMDHLHKITNPCDPALGPQPLCRLKKNKKRQSAFYRSGAGPAGDGAGKSIRPFFGRSTRTSPYCRLQQIKQPPQTKAIRSVAKT